MNMPSADVPMKPQEQTIYLLGELKGQVSSLQGSVEASQTSQASINAAVQVELASLRSDVNVLKALQPARTQWWSVASGVAAIGAVVALIVTLFAK